MKEIDANTLKQIQLDILKQIDLFCTKNKITYYMSYGTLLGAVRHKGYIPWDDDIDITMPYPDYIRFCRTFKRDEYRVNVWSKQPGFYCSFAKVDNTRTIQTEEVNSDYQIGINIDVTPLIGLSNDKKTASKHFRRIDRYRKVLNLKQMKIRRGRRIDKQILVFFSKCFTWLISYKMINRKIDRLSNKYDYSISKYIISVGAFNTDKEIFEKVKLGKTIRLPFEDYLFCAPEGYGEWLTTIFGNYMELPPEEKRISNHTFSSYWK